MFRSRASKAVLLDLCMNPLSYTIRDMMQNVIVVIDPI